MSLTTNVIARARALDALRHEATPLLVLLTPEEARMVDLVVPLAAALELAVRAFEVSASGVAYDQVAWAESVLAALDEVFEGVPDAT